jgi:4-amino-4-deoxy-L-arabinose transferase-like glycosyltransferase
VVRLPRWGLWLLCLAYVLPGFIGRDPWKTADVRSFAAMQEIAAGQTSAWLPMLAGEPMGDFAPLPHWLGAWAIRLLPTSAELAYRIPSLLALALTLSFTWHAIFRLALLPGAQPVTFAFGGQAKPVDYARTLADSGLLALMACLGLAQISHEASPAVFWMLATTGLMHALARQVSAVGPRSWRAWGPQWLTCLSTLALSGQPVLATLTALVAPLLVLWSRCTKDNTPPESAWKARPWGTWLTGLVIAAMVVGLAPQLGELDAPGSNAQGWLVYLKQMAWFAWPAWPLAAWALWRWRSHWRTPHVLYPVGLVLLVLLGSVSQDGSDRVLMASLPPMAGLVAFALPTLKRSFGAWVDWFSLLFFSFCGLAVWVVWVSLMTGVPAQPALNVARLAPGYVAEFRPLTFGVALAATLAWAAVVFWRASRHPSALWKSMVIPATGSVLCWLLLMTLWLPLLDHARSYGGVARRLAASISPTGCITAWDLQSAQVAGLMHQGHLRLLRGSPESATCEHLVTTPDRLTDRRLVSAGWMLVTRANRLTDNKEGLVLLTRPAPGGATRSDDSGDPVKPTSPDRVENEE